MFKHLNLNSISKSKSATLVFGNLALTLINFLIVVVLSNKLSINFYGQVREIMLYAGFIFLLGSAGFSQTLYFFLNKAKDEIEVLKVTGSIRGLLFLFSTFIFCGIFIFLFFFPISLSLTELLLITIYLIPLILSSVDLNLSYYHQKGKSFFIANVIIISLKLVLIVTLTQHEFSLVNFLLILALTQWFAVLSTIIVLKDKYFGRLRLKSDFLLIKKQFKYAFPIALSTILGFLILNTDKILVSILNLSKDKLAILSNISFEAPIVSTIYLSFFTIALPGMIKAFDNADFDQVLLTRFEYIFKVAKLILPIGVSFIIWNQDYIALVFGSNYKDYGFLFAIFSTISLLRFCSHHDVFLATNNTSYILYYQMIEFVFQVILSICLYHFFDLLGLVIASVITNYGYMFFVNLKSSKILKVRFVDILPFTFLINRLMILSISAVLIKYIFETLLPGIFWIIPLIIWLLMVAYAEVRILKTQNS